MSSDLAIRVRGLCKSYSIRHEAKRNVESTLAETVLKRLRNPLARGGETETFHALRDVDFDIKKGDVVGVIGRNGAGKSTLLKILSRITEPTSGRIEIAGRVGSLLEVGTGFHPELTGSENIYLNGAILGMSKAEIRKQFDAIVDFAGVEQFLDTPVKRYSSGMYVRLAFAVAAHLNSDVLIVDEVLAVGDITFQQKCLNKMADVAQLGRTILLVSHNSHAISRLANKCLLFSNGTVIGDGETDQILRQYNSKACTQELGLEYVGVGSQEVPHIARVHITTSLADGLQQHGSPLEFEVVISTPHVLVNGGLSIQIVDSSNRAIAHLWTSPRSPICKEAGETTLRCRIPRLRLYLGKYSLRIFLGERSPNRILEMVADVCLFDVVITGLDREDWTADECAYIEECSWTTRSRPYGESTSDFERLNARDH